jgi:IS30 family transposase
MKEVFVLMQEQSIKPRPKGHHLSEIERGQIAAWHIEGCSVRQIAIRLGVCHQTVLLRSLKIKRALSELQIS